MKALGWGVLAEVPGREIVMGAVTQPWMANVVFRALPPPSSRLLTNQSTPDRWTLRADPIAAGRIALPHRDAPSTRRSGGAPEVPLVLVPFSEGVC